MSPRPATLPGLFVDPPKVADTSLEAFARLQPLPERDMRWLLRAYAYLEATGYRDVTGAELAERYDVLRTDTRPRLTGCFERGWMEKGPPRFSRAEDEGRCRGYRPVLPKAAVERAQREAQKRERS